MKKNVILATTIAGITLLGASTSYANQLKTAPMKRLEPAKHYHAMIEHLQPAQKAKLMNISTGLRKEMYPKFKTLHILRVQLDGKIVDHDTQWKDIQAIVKRMEKLEKIMFTAGTKAQLNTYKATGLLLPPRVIAWASVSESK